MKTDELKIFNSPQFGDVRVIGTPEEPLFCLTDVCKVLGLRASDVVRRLEDGVVSTHTISDTIGRQQVMNFVNEDGLYDVILDSKKPEAKKFRKWVTSEVLPSIRKDGGYMTAPVNESPEETMARALLIAQKALEEKERKLQSAKQSTQILKGEVDYLLRENAFLLPKSEYTDKVLQSTTTRTFTQIGKELGFTSGSHFAKVLNFHKIIYRQSGQWLPRAKYATLGLFATRTFKPEGTDITSLYTVVTEKGRYFLHQFFNNLKTGS